MTECDSLCLSLLVLLLLVLVLLFTFHFQYTYLQFNVGLRTADALVRANTIACSTLVLFIITHLLCIE